MNTKHTLGPWHIGMHPGPIIYGADSSQVADCRGDLLGKDESLANLRLIAAAPDLLAALDQLELLASEALGVGDGRPLPFGLMDRPLGKAIGAARAVLARAKGQS
jgi:hypothetical protein